MARNLSAGCTGTDVRDLQRALNKRPPTQFAALATDGIFGPKTAARVKEYQANNGLSADGIVGPRTLAALTGPSVSATRGCDCCNGEKSVSAQSGLVSAQFATFQPAASSGNALGFVGSGSTLGASSGASSGPLRMLDTSQQTTATAVYGSSLDFSTIFISDKTGLGNRPFTVALPSQGQIFQIINCGTFSPDKDTLIHELCHVWQSQHHSDKFRFMVNAIDSQAGAATANAAEAVDDPFIMLNKDFPLFWPFDAYASNPGLPFASLAAEQMASAVEHGVSAIVSHVKGVAMNTVDPACVTALSRPGFADRRMPGVK